jgi:nitrate reductase beta subunit
MRIPVEYLAELFTAGDVEPVNEVLRKLAAMRAYMRDINLGQEPDATIAARVGMTAEEMEAMFHLLAIAKYEDRYVVPTAHNEAVSAFQDELPGCSVDWSAQPGEAGIGESKPIPVTIESFHLTKQRMQAETHDEVEGPK